MVSGPVEDDDNYKGERESLKRGLRSIMEGLWRSLEGPRRNWQRLGLKGVGRAMAFDGGGLQGT